MSVSRFDIYCNTRVFTSQPEEKSKFDGIFESLSPLNGLLSGDKVKPVLINSNLPLDVLGKVPVSVKKYIRYLYACSDALAEDGLTRWN